MRLHFIFLLLSACTCTAPKATQKPPVEQEWTLILGETAQGSEALACSVEGNVLKCEDFATVVRILAEKQAKEDAERL